MKRKTITPAGLIRAAASAARHAYCPYSRFRVGAAVLTDDNRVFAGCNVENASYGLTVCAERNAVAAAVVAGARRITAVAIVAGGKTPVLPCGACRQVFFEFATRGATVYSANPTRLRDIETHPMHDLLPGAFSLTASRTTPRRRRVR